MKFTHYVTSGYLIRARALAILAIKRGMGGRPTTAVQTRWRVRIFWFDNNDIDYQRVTLVSSMVECCSKSNVPGSSGSRIRYGPCSALASDVELMYTFIAPNVWDTLCLIQLECCFADSSPSRYINSTEWPQRVASPALALLQRRTGSCGRSSDSSKSSRDARLNRHLRLGLVPHVSLEIIAFDHLELARLARLEIGGRCLAADDTNVLEAGDCVGIGFVQVNREDA